MNSHNYYSALIHGGGVVVAEYVIATICERFGWTWDEYFSQPINFLRVIEDKLKTEQEIKQEEEKRQANGM